MFLENEYELYLGEMNGKYSEIIANYDNFTFYDGNDNSERDKVSDYIVKNGKDTDINYFAKVFADQYDYDCAITY
jgi:hypothetical protein